MTQYANIHAAVRAAFLAEVKPSDLVRPDLHEGAAGCVATRAASVLADHATAAVAALLAWAQADDALQATNTAANAAISGTRAQFDHAKAAWREAALAEQVAREDALKLARGLDAASKGTQ